MPRRTNTRERLISTAAELFCRQGYAHTGVNEIMQRARTTSGSFYHFFPTKEDLVLAVVDHIAEELDTTFSADSTGTLDPLDRVVASYRRLLETHDFALGSPIGSLAAELSESHPQVRERLSELVATWIDRMEGLLESADDPVPFEGDRSDFAEFVLSVLEGAVIQARVRRSMAPFDGAVAVLRSTFDGTGGNRDTRSAPEQRLRPAPSSAPGTADWRAW